MVDVTIDENRVLRQYPEQVACPIILVDQLTGWASQLDKINSFDRQDLAILGQVCSR